MECHRSWGSHGGPERRLPHGRVYGDCSGEDPWTPSPRVTHRQGMCRARECTDPACHMSIVSDLPHLSNFRDIARFNVLDSAKGIPHGRSKQAVRNINGRKNPFGRSCSRSRADSILADIKSIVTKRPKIPPPVKVIQGSIAGELYPCPGEPTIEQWLAP